MTEFSGLDLYRELGVEEEILDETGQIRQMDYGMLEKCL